MYVCKDCGTAFTEDEMISVEGKNYDDDTPYIDRYVIATYCPNCGSDHIAESHECKACGEHTENNVLCDECRDALEAEMEKIRNNMNLNEDDFAEAVADIFGW